MASFERRLQQLEQIAARQSKPAPPAGQLQLQRAMSALFDLLEAHYPHQGWASTDAGAPLQLTTLHQASEAAARIAAGEPSEADLAALAALDASDAIKVCGLTAADFIREVAEPPLSDEAMRELEKAAAEEAAAEARARR